MLRASALSSLRPLSGVHALAESRPLLTASNCSERSEACRRYRNDAQEEETTTTNSEMQGALI